MKHLGIVTPKSSFKISLPCVKILLGFQKSFCCFWVWNKPCDSIMALTKCNLRFRICQIVLPLQYTYFYRFKPRVASYQPLLRPASDGWGKVQFSVCQFTPRGRGYSIQGLGGGYPIPGPGGGYPIPGPGGDTPSLVQVGVPHRRSRWGYPIPGLGGGYPIPGPGGGTPSCWCGGYLPSRTGWGTPCPGLDGVLPPSGDQHNEHLLRGGWCASCVHAGGLSC